MNPKKMRILIATDVIEQIRAEKYIALESNAYVEIVRVDDEVKNLFNINHWLDEYFCAPESEESSAKEVVDHIKCQVCGIGSMFLSHIRHFNKVNLRDMCGATSGSIHDTMSEYFSEEQLNMIEVAFEKDLEIVPHELVEWDEDNRLNLPERYQRALDYCDDLEGNFLLMAIMQNIINNDGEFCP